MDQATRKEVARKGGLAVSRNREHMAEIGRKGGQTSPRIANTWPRSAAKAAQPPVAVQRPRALPEVKAASTKGIGAVSGYFLLLRVIKE